jgi:hypothetical protein
MTKTKKILAWVLTGLFAFLFIFSGVQKLMRVEIQIKVLENFGFGTAALIPFAIVEFIFAITILIPKTRKLTIYAIFTWALIACALLLRNGHPPIVSIIFVVVGSTILWLQKETKINNQLSNRN